MPPEYYRRDDGVPGWGYARVTFWPWLFSRVVLDPVFAFEQWWMCWVWAGERHRLVAPGIVASRLHHRASEWMGRHSVAYRWNEPVEPELGEIGFHSLCAGKRGRDPLRIFVTPHGTSFGYDGATITASSYETTLVSNTASATS